MIDLPIILSAAGLLISLITMILVIVCLRKIGGKQEPAVRAQASAFAQESAASKTEPSAGVSDGVGIVFCRSCGNQYDSAQAVCPNCNTPR